MFELPQPPALARAPRRALVLAFLLPACDDAVVPADPIVAPAPVHDVRCDVIPFVEARRGTAEVSERSPVPGAILVSGIRPGSVLSELGLHNGDLVVAARAVDGRCEWDIGGALHGERTVSIDPASPIPAPTTLADRLVMLNGIYTGEMAAAWVAGDRPLEVSCTKSSAPFMMTTEQPISYDEAVADLQAHIADVGCTLIVEADRVRLVER